MVPVSENAALEPTPVSLNEASEPTAASVWKASEPRAVPPPGRWAMQPALGCAAPGRLAASGSWATNLILSPHR